MERRAGLSRDFERAAVSNEARWDRNEFGGLFYLTNLFSRSADSCRNTCESISLHENLAVILTCAVFPLSRVWRITNSKDSKNLHKILSNRQKMKIYKKSGGDKEEIGILQKFESARVNNFKSGLELTLSFSLISQGNTGLPDRISPGADNRGDSKMSHLWWSTACSSGSMNTSWQINQQSIAAVDGTCKLRLDPMHQILELEIYLFLPKSSHDIGHFTQMAYDRATHVGCAFARYTNNYKTGLFACNYSSGNIKGYKVYSCGLPATGCRFGKNPNYPALCSVNEPIDPNQIY